MRAGKPYRQLQHRRDLGVPVIRNGRLQIPAVQREIASREADQIRDRVDPVTGETIRYVRSASVVIGASVGRELVTTVVVLIT